MRRQIVIVGTSAVLGLALLGAGCRPQPQAAPTNSSSQQPMANAAPSSSQDPLADDLDAAIEDLESIE